MGELRRHNGGERIFVMEEAGTVFEKCKAMCEAAGLISLKHVASQLMLCLPNNTTREYTLSTRVLHHDVGGGGRKKVAGRCDWRGRV